MKYTREEAEAFLAERVRIKFTHNHNLGRVEDDREGHAEEVALALYAEGNLKFLPVYVLDDKFGELLVEYIYVKDIRDLVAFPVAFPPDLGRFAEEAAPGSVDEMIDKIEATHPSETQSITPVATGTQEE